MSDTIAQWRALKTRTSSKCIETGWVITVSTTPYLSQRTPTNGWNGSQCERTEHIERMPAKLHTDNAGARVQEIQLNIVLIKRKGFAQIDGIISNDDE